MCTETGGGLAAYVLNEQATSDGRNKTGTGWHCCWSGECCLQRQTSDHYSLSLKLSVNIYIVHVFPLNFVYNKFFPVGLMSADTHARSIACQYCWNISSGTVLRVIVFYSGLWWTMKHGNTILKSQENLHTCNWDTLLHLSMHTQASASKVIFIVLFDSYGPLLLDFK
jgi:hypothetical protein